MLVNLLEVQVRCWGLALIGGHELGFLFIFCPIFLKWEDLVLVINIVGKRISTLICHPFGKNYANN